MRLGFAIAATMDPDVLLLDEIFAVGDADFQRQCMATLAVVPDARQDHHLRVALVGRRPGRLPAGGRPRPRPPAVRWRRGRRPDRVSSPDGLVAARGARAREPATALAADAARASSAASPHDPDLAWHRLATGGQWSEEGRVGVRFPARGRDCGRDHVHARRRLRQPLGREPAAALHGAEPLLGIREEHRALHRRLADRAAARRRAARSSATSSSTTTSTSAEAPHRFDLAIASSLFRRLPLNSVARAIAGVVRALTPGRTVLRDLARQSPDAHRLRSDRAARTRCTTYSDREPFHYSFEMLAALAEVVGARAERAWTIATHPRGEAVMVITRSIVVVVSGFAGLRVRLKADTTRRFLVPDQTTNRSLDLTARSVSWRRRATKRAARRRAERDVRGDRGRARRPAPAHRALPAGPAGLGRDAVADRRDPRQQLLARHRNAPAAQDAGWTGARSAGARRSVVARPVARQVPAFVRTAPLGVNVAGYLDTESGMGEAARASIRSLEAAGMPVALNNVASRLRKRDASYAAAFVETQPASRSTSCTSTPTTWGGSPTAAAATTSGTATPSATGSGSWRRFAKSGCRSSTTSTRCGRRASSSANRSPPGRPCPSCACRCPSSCHPCRRSAARISASPTRGTVFLYIFDVSSQTERKNPRGAIEAFRRARFDRDDAAVLVLKFTNAEYDRDAVRRLHEQADGLARASSSTATWIGPSSARCSQRDGLLRLAAPFRRLRPDDARVDAPREAGDRDGVLRQHGLHDGREQLPVAAID